MSETASLTAAFVHSICHWSSHPREFSSGNFTCTLQRHGIKIENQAPEVHNKGHFSFKVAICRCNSNSHIFCCNSHKSVPVICVVLAHDFQGLHFSIYLIHTFYSIIFLYTQLTHILFQYLYCTCKNSKLTNIEKLMLKLSLGLNYGKISTTNV